MSSQEDRQPSRTEKLEALLEEHGVDASLAEQLRSLLSAMRPPEERSSERPRALLPPVAEPEPVLRVDQARLAEQLTQPARKLLLDSSVAPAPRTPSSTAPESELTRPSARPPADSKTELGPLRAASLGVLVSEDEGGVVPVSLLAEGGMGEVYRARDRSLSRDLAMKVLRTVLADRHRMRDRFLDEAQITAQLAHPSIPPVHTLGSLPDGRPYFTMKHVHGRTLAELLGEQSLSEQRRLEVFSRVCEAVSYAHARGVVHCDLKPLNIMIGSFGEVLVMDWGVARLVSPAQSATPSHEPPVQTTASGVTTSWEVAGTPAYMPPEQALGQADRIGPASDVYALGVMLFELVAGARPYEGPVPELLLLASQGRVPPVPRRAGSTADEALDAIIARAMRPEPEDRYADAGALGEEVSRWREGSMRREKALRIVREAQQRLETMRPLKQRSKELAREAAELLSALSADAGPERRKEGWRKSDAAAALERQLALRLTEVEQMLEAALAQSPGLPEPKRLLAELAYERHCEAEARRAWDEAARIEVVLRAHDQGEYAAYLEGKARLTLATCVPATAELLRYVLRDRRLVLEPVSHLGSTPLLDVELTIGSYAVELRAERRLTVRLPVVLRRLRDAHFSREEGGSPSLLWLPEEGSLDAREAYVPSGWHDSGVGEDARPVWVEGFVMQRHPVTCRELAQFLTTREGAPFRRGVLRDGASLFRADLPAVGLSWEGAQAYAHWHSERTGRAWRLPYELEWERAARGPDGRVFPWGDTPESAFAHLRADGRTPSRVAPVQRFAYDLSPFGVSGMAGNVRDWCADLSVDPSSVDGRTPSATQPRRAVRGGSFRLPLDAARTYARASLPSAQGYADVGFRLVYSVGR